MRFRCVNGNVVARRFDPIKQIGSIILPDEARKKNEFAMVVQCCEDEWLEDGNWRSSALKPGDVILVSKYSGQNVDADSSEYVVVKEKDILVIVDDYEPSAIAPATADPTADPETLIPVPTFAGID